MPGGGPQKVAPGQITDDGELALCLLTGLINGKGNLNLKEIVKMYAKWIESKPFDIGGTIRASFFKASISNPLPYRLKAASHKDKNITS